MDDLFLRARLSGTREVCISPLPAKTYREAGARGLGGELGYFIYEIDTANPSAGVEVMGKAASVDAALRIFDIIRKSADEVIEG
jgi:hypothetical protein